MTAFAVEMSGIKKSYGGIHALRGVDLSVREGTIHALVGENGAGKSTLLKILQGVAAPNAGSIKVLDKPLVEHTPEASRQLGLGMIFQELSLVPTMSVAENIFLNRERRRGFGLFVDRAAEHREAERLLASLGVNINPRETVIRLSTGEMQMTEIAKALSQDAKVLILDEPTAALSTAEVEHLFDFLRGFRQHGLSAIYVSHRMDEIVEIADDVTILRDGQNVLATPLAQTSLEDIIEAMIGKKVESFTYLERPIERSRQPIFEIRGLCGDGKPDRCDLKVYPGEIVGIAGLMGSGRSELVRAVFGIDLVRSGEVLVDGKVVAIRRPLDAIAAGIALIPESRQVEGLVVDHSVATNLSLPQIDALKAGVLVDKSRERRLASDLIGKLRIKANSPEARVRSLSGGNQQKIVIAKWLATDPRVVILDESTAGIDIGSKGEIVDLVRALADSGKAVVVISSEPAELLALSDRILIMAKGRIARELSRSEIAAWSGEQTASGQVLKSEHALQVAIQKANANVQ